MTPDMAAFNEWWHATIIPQSGHPDPRVRVLACEAWHAAVAAERERCAKIAEQMTVGLAGFVESDRMRFAVENMAKLKAAIAAAIRETP